VGAGLPAPIQPRDLQRLFFFLRCGAESRFATERPKIRQCPLPFPFDRSSSRLIATQFRPGRLEGYTTFAERSAFITFPDSTVGFWWTKRPAPDGSWGAPSVVQLLRVKEVKYRKGTPP
jgi:hypothetical protein